METKHTPGEWKFFKSENNQVSTFYCNGNTNIYDFEIRHNEKNFSETEANAKLIAAAPELLEALNILLNYKDIIDGYLSAGTDQRKLPYKSIFIKAEQAIKKAIE